MRRKPDGLELLQYWNLSSIRYSARMSLAEPVDRTALLRRHGVQVTAQRLAVLRAVSSRPHSTAADIEAVVQDDIGAISLQAVYDALGTLADTAGGAALGQAVRELLVKSPPPTVSQSQDAVESLQATYAAQEQAALMIAAALDATA